MGLELQRDIEWTPRLHSRLSHNGPMNPSNAPKGRVHRRPSRQLHPSLVSSFWASSSCLQGCPTFGTTIQEKTSFSSLIHRKVRQMVACGFHVKSFVGGVCLFPSERDDPALFERGTSHHLTFLVLQTVRRASKNLDLDQILKIADRFGRRCCWFFWRCCSFLFLVLDTMVADCCESTDVVSDSSNLGG